MDAIKDIKKIDVHAHAALFREYYPPHEEGKPERVFVSAQQVIDFYDKLGIEKGILLPISSPEGQLSPMTSEACKYLTVQYPDRFYWFCNVDPRAYPNTTNGDLAAILRHYKALGAKGVGEITSHLDMDDPKVINLFSACEACDMPIIIHIANTHAHGYGLYDEVGLPRLEKQLAMHPNLKIIGHSQPFWAEISADVTDKNRGGYPTGKVQEGGRLIQLMRKYPNLYCDLSAGSGHNALMRDEEFAIRFIEEFPDRIMYGEDICHPTNEHPFPFRDFLDRLVAEGKLKPEHYRKIARENAIAVLKLDA